MKILKKSEQEDPLINLIGDKGNSAKEANMNFNQLKINKGLENLE